MSLNEEKQSYLTIRQHRFAYVCRIIPVRNEDGSVKEFLPQDRYNNRKGLPLNRYGEGPYCKFKIPNDRNYGGVYAILVDGDIKYIGECQNLSSRFNSGYGNISPRNCFVGGQETNCRINNLILGSVNDNQLVSMWFLRTEDYNQVEQELRDVLEPKWNRV